ncbi:hypothetical protein AB0B30_18150 [Streptomyces narbonensis]|uniref:Uncharacterized protein n=1 Tax=Streptomyces narbonensis TaxID=67333 RepID=A0ABV3C614_9ACTN
MTMPRSTPRKPSGSYTSASGSQDAVIERLRRVLAEDDRLRLCPKAALRVTPAKVSGLAVALQRGVGVAHLLHDPHSGLGPEAVVRLEREVHLLLQHVPPLEILGERHRRRVVRGPVAGSQRRRQRVRIMRRPAVKN